MGGPEARSRGFKKNKVEAQKKRGGSRKQGGGVKKTRWVVKKTRSGGQKKTRWRVKKTWGQKTRVPIRKAKTHPNSSMSNCPMFPTGLLLTMM